MGGMGGMGGMPITEVACDVALCDVSGSGICCLPKDSQADMPICMASGACTEATHTPVTCDEPGDCPGQQCCGTFSNPVYTTVECTNMCNGNNEFRLCDTTADCSGNDQCEQSLFLPTGYLVCK